MCVPQQISFPQDINLLNEARENFGSFIYDICSGFNYYKPRMYRRNARKDCRNLAKCQKHTAKKIRKAIKKELQYANRDPGYVDILEQENVFLKPKQTERLEVIRGLVKQQQYIRPIVRKKAKSPAFDAYNECDVLIRAIERYHSSTRRYPENSG